MKGRTLEPRQTFYAGLLPLLLAGGLAVNCSSSSDNSKPANIAGASGNIAGAANNAGAAGAATTAGAGGSASGGETGGMQPVNGMCVLSSSKHSDGLCYCQPSSLTYCADACADVKVDPDHCGSCSTKCSDAQGCIAQKCSNTPSALVPAAAGCGSLKLLLSGTTLYWTNAMKGTVNSIPVAGGTAKEIATGEMNPTTLAVNGTNVYWFAKGSKSIRKKALDGTGAASDVVASSVVTTACIGFTGTTECGIGGFTISAAGDLYYSVGTKIFKIPTVGGTPGATVTVGHEDSGIPTALAVEDDLIGFPADVNGDVDVIKAVGTTDAFCKTEVNTDNTNCIRVARSQGSLILDSVFMSNKVVYWVDGSSVKSNSATSNDPAMMGSNVTISGSDSSLSAFTVSGSTTYFADKSDGGFVYMAPLTANSTATLIARKQIGITSIAGDPSGVYWAAGDCSIMSLPLGASGIGTL
jgi:hypothetical protein